MNDVQPPAEGGEVSGVEDEALTERVRQGDVDAYRALVERNIDRAYGLALRILGNAADADDVTQDAFVKAWIHRGNWQAGRAKFSTWLYRVIVNRCIDLKRAPKGVWIEDVPEPTDQSEEAGDALHKREVFGRLDEALNRLPNQQRIVLILSYHEDLGNAEIAELLGTTVSAVESLLKRGRKRLRELMRRSEADVRRLLGSN
ncbi:MAG TPA: sigma-70 family RNA polymerase sigma factor [Dongiaceae bacterium]|nr:sigma-70 family RNA polymerase sigma factor [Dongiaceae bacterium]